MKNFRLLFSITGFFSLIFLQAQGWLHYTPLNSANSINTKIVPHPSGGYVLFSYQTTLSNLPYIRRIDSLGNVLWTKALPSASSWTYEGCGSITNNANGFMAATVFFQPSDPNVDDIWLMQLDLSGDTVWTRRIPKLTSEEHVSQIEKSSDGGYYIAYTSSNSQLTASDTISLMKVDSLGNLLWEIGHLALLGAYDYESQEIRIATTSDGGCWFAYNTVNDFTAERLDATGNTISSFPFPGYIRYDISSTSDGGAILSSDWGTLKLDMFSGMVWGFNESSFFSGSCTEVNPSNGDVYVLYSGTDPLGISLDSYWRFLHLDSMGFVIDSSDFTQSGIFGIPADLRLMPDGFLMAVGEGQYGDGFALRMNTDGLLYTNTISGRIYNDVNGNCTYDINENGFKGWIVEANGAIGTFYAITDSLGNYSMNVGLGTYVVIQHIPNTRQPICPISPNQYSVVFNTTHTNMNQQDFANEFVPGAEDVQISFTNLCPLRIDWDVPFRLDLKNNGSVNENGIVAFSFDTTMAVISTSIAPALSQPGLLTWSYSNLLPEESRYIIVVLHTPLSASMFDSAYFSTGITIAGTDMNPTDNTDLHGLMYVASFDPNEKSVYAQGIGPNGEIDPGDELTYTIYFQNTGTDTAFNIRIEDCLDPGLDIGSLQVISSSANYDVQLQNSNNLVWTFENIMLPDSFINEQLSHGFIKYRIKAKSNLSNGTHILNTAYIYFDINPPIVTNTTDNIISLPMGLSSNVIHSEYKLFPNPSVGSFNIIGNFATDSRVQFYNSFGQEAGLPIEISSGLSSSEINLDLPNGIYFYRIFSGTKSVAEGKLSIVH